MKKNIKNILELTLINHPLLESCRPKILQASLLLKQCYSKGGKVLVCGNGGSAADSEHIVGELMKGFLLKRKIPQVDINRLKASFPDDWEYFSNNLQGALPAISLVSQISISTAKVAKAIGIGTIGLTGASGGLMNMHCDINITVPATETYKIQELHLPLYHALCAMLEADFFEE